MPSKLRKAIGAVKDQTSISLAKVTNAANLEVVILKATTHDEVPMEERYVNEIVHLVSSNKVYAAACAQAIGKRIGKTRNWVVALKSLMAVLRIFQDGDPYFPREVFHAMKRGAKILNLSSFRDDSSSSPWDYTAFIRTFALYLDERLDCFLTGKLQRRFTLKNPIPFKNQKNNKLIIETGIKDMKPTMLLDRIGYWQRLLDRAIGTKPTGPARLNRLVQISLYAIVQETFDLYRDISDGLAVILDSFFKLPCKACLTAFQACVKSSKQFDELSGFYEFCLSIGVGRTSEYPSVQKISEELMETLQEFLRDQANNNARSPSPLSKHFLVPTTKDIGSSSSGQDEGSERYGTPERYYENGSEFGSQCTSLEDLMSATDSAAITPSRRSIEKDLEYEQHSEQDEKQSQNGDLSSAYESCSNHSSSIDQTAWSSLDLVSFDDLQHEQEQKNTELGSNNNGSKDCWELVLVETATAPEKTTPNLANEFEPPVINTLFDQLSVPQHHYNPFLELEDIATVAPPPTSTTNLTLSTIENQSSLIDFFDGSPTFQPMAEPTFRAHQDIPREATMAPPTFTAQSSNSETDLALIFGDLNPNALSITAPSFHAQGSAESNMAVAPNCNAKTSDEKTTAPNFYVQDPFEIGSTPSSHAPNSYQTSTAPTFYAQGSSEIGSAPTSHVNNSYQTSTAPTFHANNSYHTSPAPNFYVNNSYQTSPEPNFHVNNSYQTSTAPNFHANNLYHTSPAPNFDANDSYQMSTAPTFHVNNSYQTNPAPTYYGHNSYPTSAGPAPTFHGHNSYQTSSSAPTMRTPNVNMSMVPAAPTFAVNNPNEALVPSNYWAQNLHETMAAPTFSAKVSNETMVTAHKEDDPFGPWPSKLTNEHASVA